MKDDAAMDQELQAELKLVAERGRRQRQAATSETAPDIVQSTIETALAPIHPKPTGRLLQLEILAVTAAHLPRVTREVGDDHPLTIEWRKMHDKTVTWLDRDGVDRMLRAI